MRRVFVTAWAALALVRCSSFESEPSNADASVAPPVEDAASSSDGGAESGKARTVRCGATTCDLDSGEVCCLYRAGAERRAVCGPAGSCPPAGPTETFETEASCDDKSDCADGLVCCHTRKFCVAAIALDSARCVAPSNCGLCLNDGGSGEIACDPTQDDGCPTGSCKSQVEIVVSNGYCR